MKVAKAKCPERPSRPADSFYLLSRRRFFGKIKDMKTTNNQKKKITFISTYPPIMCGIANYLKNIIEQLPENTWQVISFKLRKSKNFKILPEREKEPNTHYILPRTEIRKVAKRVNRLANGSVVWIQHEFGIWGRENNCAEFVKFIAEIKGKKIITFHTIHFQSNETPYGLKEIEYKLLENILPLVDTITVFSDGAYLAVCGAFPDFKDKVVVLRHHCKFYPPVPTKNAKEKLIESLLSSKTISSKSKKQLENLGKIISKKNVKLIGDIGFISPSKGSEIIYLVRDELEKKINQKVISMYIGTVQDPTSNEQVNYAKKLKSFHDGKKNFFINLYIPERTLNFYLKAFDAIIFWPNDCTQSGRLSILQGVGVCGIGKDMEGVGETMKLSALPTVKTYGSLINVLARVLTRPDSKNLMIGMTRTYARKFRCSIQAKKTLRLANAVKGRKKRVLILDRGYGAYLYETWKEQSLPEWF
jgi:hypothetical protein